jgi:hypothetical protein
MFGALSFIFGVIMLLAVLALNVVFLAIAVETSKYQVSENMKSDHMQRTSFLLWVSGIISGIFWGSLVFCISFAYINKK